MFLNTNRMISRLYNNIIHVKIPKEQSFNAKKFNLLHKTDELTTLTH